MPFIDLTVDALCLRLPARCGSLCQHCPCIVCAWVCWYLRWIIFSAWNVSAGATSRSIASGDTAAQPSSAWGLLCSLAQRDQNITGSTSAYVTAVLHAVVSFQPPTVLFCLFVCWQPSHIISIYQDLVSCDVHSLHIVATPHWQCNHLVSRSKALCADIANHVSISALQHACRHLIMHRFKLLD